MRPQLAAEEMGDSGCKFQTGILTANLSICCQGNGKMDIWRDSITTLLCYILGLAAAMYKIKTPLSVFVMSNGFLI